MTVPMTRKAFCARLTGASIVLLIQACGRAAATHRLRPAPTRSARAAPTGPRRTTAMC